MRMSDEKKDILPDCRLKTIVTPKGMVQGPGGMYVPIFCYWCGKRGGLVHEESCTFVFWSCDPCTEKFGAIAGLMAIPDEVFWAKVHQAEIETKGRLLTNEERAALVESGTSALAKLLTPKR